MNHPVSLVTGATGMLGSALVPILEAEGHTVYATSRQPGRGIDIQDYKALKFFIQDIQPDLIFHLAAETDLVKCQNDTAHAYLVNAIGTQNVCLAAREVGTTLIYVSTAGVFNGKKGSPYTEFDTPNPLSVYGKSKLEGERFVERLMDKYFIVRAGWMMGGGIKDKKFVAKIVHKIKSGVKELRVINDHWGTPTYTADLARVLAFLCKQEHYGTYHAACLGSATRFDVANEILNWREGRGGNPIDLTAISSEEYAESYPVPRSEILTNYLLSLHGWNTMRPWQVALREYLDKEWDSIGEGVR